MPGDTLQFAYRFVHGRPRVALFDFSNWRTIDYVRADPLLPAMAEDFGFKWPLPENDRIAILHIHDAYLREHAGVNLPRRFFE